MLKSEAATLAANKRLSGATEAIAAEKERIARLQEVVQRERERKEVRFTSFFWTIFFSSF